MLHLYTDVIVQTMSVSVYKKPHFRYSSYSISCIVYSSSLKIKLCLVSHGKDYVLVACVLQFDSHYSLTVMGMCWNCKKPKG